MGTYSLYHGYIWHTKRIMAKLVLDLHQRG